MRSGTQVWEFWAFGYQAEECNQSSVTLTGTIYSHTVLPGPTCGPSPAVVSWRGGADPWHAPPRPPLRATVGIETFWQRFATLTTRHPTTPVPGTWIKQPSPTPTLGRRGGCGLNDLKPKRSDRLVKLVDIAENMFVESSWQSELMR